MADLSGGIYDPFWRDLPYANIHLSTTPDVLHQLYQGVFAHILTWATDILGPKELDHRIRTLPPFHDMAKIILACLVGRISNQALLAFRSILDFIYLAQYPTHNAETLSYMKDALATFQKHKDVFIKLGIREHLNIPKFHSLLHYIESICLFGTTDNYNTEMFERLHIDYAKKAWRSTNHCDERPQMVRWLERREKMATYERYIKHHIPSTFLTDISSSSHDHTGTSEITIKGTPDVPSASIKSIEATHSAPGFERALKEFINKHSFQRTSQKDIAIKSLPFDSSWAMQRFLARLWIPRL
ncbi:uncharacterized protein STEHIDRAFT_129333 [Stereum hirsutum FP-91666 SS1]|uniref:uncharacterized protein n=1 Tax=Stereum hirsutum (strain FP-91666) TaxID=721885 RepID=UPI000440C52B|nr:uncharacterized protein STEHIDRAFT_129333 [Stereum hirsutum FP-91666 SS1]EIM88648.1 hypothetical protein STEHIDRAFT_129333 [Stereum hirsutum FP-91666 SS1]